MNCDSLTADPIVGPRFRESGVPSHPVLIVNLKSGNGRAAAIDLVGTAQRLGLETVTMQPGDDLAELAVRMVDGGCDHLMMAGGDGSLAIVAEVAMARGVPFSCVPVGTRNHFAMDLGLDRSHPLQSLDAALDGSEQLIDVGILAGQVFLNNVSFGLYPRAIADPEYRSHRARSMADAAVDTVSHLETQITITLPDGRVVSDIEVLLTSNNPYRFIGPPDFARRPALDTGTLGMILADRRSRQKRGPAAFTRWETQKLTVHADPVSIQVGVDGELRQFRSPIEVAIAPKSLRVLVPRQTSSKSLKESIDQLSERAIVHLSGSPGLPRPSELDANSPLLPTISRVRRGGVQRDSGMGVPSSRPPHACIVASSITLQDLDRNGRCDVARRRQERPQDCSGRPRGSRRSPRFSPTWWPKAFSGDGARPIRCPRREVCRCRVRPRCPRATPHLPLRSLASWARHIPVSGSHSMPSPPRSDSPGSTPECTTRPMSSQGGSSGTGLERSQMRQRPRPVSALGRIRTCDTRFRKPGRYQDSRCPKSRSTV